MSDLTRGLHDRLLTNRLTTLLSSLGAGDEPDLTTLRNAEAADRIALHLASVVERIIDTLPEKERAELGAQLAARIIEQITRDPKTQPLQVERPTSPPQVLRAILGRKPDGTLDRIEQPEIPLLDTTLLTNAPGEPRVQSQIIKEIESADRIDLIMAFIRRSGLYPLRDRLRRHVQRGRALRVLTTVYTGSTELEALLLLRDDIGAEVRVSYDTSSSRLHAKSWLFHRESGFSTAYVGSSNLTHSAQVDGLEWNVRLSAARNRPVLEKIAAVFESYWQQADFEALDEERFRKAIRSDDGIELSPLEVTLRPFQERLLEEIEMSRARGMSRNLLVSATGTGKTVMAAVDYARLRTRLPRARLLFVAHREEILRQSRNTFRHALRDGKFGELWVGGHRPEEFDFVFASIQSLAASGLESLDPQHFDVVIVDEFHHAAATTYRKLLALLQPQQLLGLTATPERSDGESVLHWFDGRIAAELRLWDAIDQHRLSPFAYFGIADELDLREIPWRRGTGYDVEGLTQLITGTDVWARKVLQEFRNHVADVGTTRALGFCVSVDHARYMARVFQAANVKAVAVWADTPEDERKRALDDLAARRVNVVFSIDLFNEGVDVPAVDALLMLRPTDSALLFLQQLGRGLRKAPGKTVCTVLDFVGQHRKEFRYDRRFQALLGGSRTAVADQIERGFPFLPAGCHMELDRVAQQRVLDNIRNAIPLRWAAKAQELAKLEQEHPGLTLRHFLELSGLELDDVCDGKRSWSDLRELAGLSVAAKGPEEEKLRRACGRLTHVDDVDRLDTWTAWLAADQAPQLHSLGARERRQLTMLLAPLFDQVAEKDATIERGATLLWAHPQIREELLSIFAVLRDRVSHLTRSLDQLPDVPLRVHARYSRHEILAATGASTTLKSRTWREGVLYSDAIKADVFVFTLDKTGGQFSPTTRYKDYAITPSLVHWESQSGTSAKSPTGQRYQQHETRRSHVLLFGRRSADDRAFHFLGPARYVSHTGELPMAVTWRLEVALPGDLFQGFAAAVA